MRFHQPGFPGIIGRYSSHHDVGVAADIFGRRLHRQIDAMSERVEMQGRCPGVVHNDGGAALMCDLRDRRNVLHLERKRAGTFQEHGLGLGLELLCYIRADVRFEIGRGNPVLFPSFWQNTRVGP